jgi:hypothetical protein
MAVIGDAFCSHSATHIRCNPRAGERHPGGDDMKRLYAVLAIAAVAALGAAAGPAAHAAPPTVVPSPGYDARLQEQRDSRAIPEPAMPVARPVTRRHVRHHHDVVR